MRQRVAARKRAVGMCERVEQGHASFHPVFPDAAAILTAVSRVLG